MLCQFHTFYFILDISFRLVLFCYSFHWRFHLELFLSGGFIFQILYGKSIKLLRTIILSSHGTYLKKPQMETVRDLITFILHIGFLMHTEQNHQKIQFWRVLFPSWFRAQLSRCFTEPVEDCSYILVFCTETWYFS